MGRQGRRGGGGGRGGARMSNRWGQPGGAAPAGGGYAGPTADSCGVHRLALIVLSANTSHQYWYPLALSMADLVDTACSYRRGCRASREVSEGSGAGSGTPRHGVALVGLAPACSGVCGPGVGCAGASGPRCSNARSYMVARGSCGGRPTAGRAVLAVACAAPQTSCSGPRRGERPRACGLAWCPAGCEPSLLRQAQTALQ